MDTQNQVASQSLVQELIRGNTQQLGLPLTGRKILVLGANRLFRDTLKLFLESEGFAIIAAQGAAEFSKSIHLSEIPDVIVYSLNIETEIEEDLAMIKVIRQGFPGALTLVLAGTANTATFTRIVYSGVEGLMTQNISGEILRRAVQFLLLGQHLIPHGLFPASEQPPVIAPKSEPISDRHDFAADGPRPVAISRRERDIMQCLIDGLSNKAIARKLSVAEATVKVHVKGLLRKLQVSNRTQAAIWGLNHSGVRQSDEQQKSSPARELL